MNALSSLRQKLNRSKRYRESFPAAVVKRMLPLQVLVLRKQRGWSQAQLAKESKLTQGVISRAEDPDYGNLTVNTLVRIAGGFDCAFIGRFVPFSELAKWYTSITDERTLEVPSFEDDRAFNESAVKEQELEEVFTQKAVSPVDVPPVPWLGLGGDQSDQERLEQVRAVAVARWQSVMKYLAGGQGGTLGSGLVSTPTSLRKPMYKATELQTRTGQVPNAPSVIIMPATPPYQISIMDPNPIFVTEKEQPRYA